MEGTGRRKEEAPGGATPYKMDDGTEESATRLESEWLARLAVGSGDDNLGLRSRLTLNGAEIYIDVRYEMDRGRMCSGSE